MKISKKIILSLSLLLTSSYSTTIKDSIRNTILTNDEFISNTLEVSSSKKDIRIEESGLYPKLDLNSKYQQSRANNNNDGWLKKDKTKGASVTLEAEQLLYDGQKTSNKIKEKEFYYQSAFYKSTYKNESILLDVAKSYLDIVKENELYKIALLNQKTHNETLEIALNKEEISGEVLETKNTQAMIVALNDRLFNQKLRKDDSAIKFEKLTNLSSKNLCKPKINEALIPKTLNEAILFAQKNNLKIKEQITINNAQLSKVKQKDGNYKPTVKLKAQTAYDDGIELNEDGGFQKKTLAEVSLNWNLYNGGRDENTIEKEKINALKEKKALENVKLETTKKITTLYKEYYQIKDRIKNFQKSLEINNEILTITNSKLEDGTKTFADVLLAKARIYDVQSDIVKQEFELSKKYYEILNELSILKITILNSKYDKCNIKAKVKKPKIIEKEEDSLDPLLDELLLSIDDNTTETVKAEPIPNPLKEIFVSNQIPFNEEELSAIIPITSNSFTIKKVNSRDKFANTLNSIHKPLLEYIKQNNNLNKVIIQSHTSSEFTKYKNNTSNEKTANFGLSKRRAIKVKNYFYDKAKRIYGDTSFLNNKLKISAQGSNNTIKNDNGSENKTLSRRIVFKFIEN
jgi:adhesin transport system outer membrane protein